MVTQANISHASVGANIPTQDMHEFVHSYAFVAHIVYGVDISNCYENNNVMHMCNISRSYNNSISNQYATPI
jgi:hypothetical protein